MKIGPMARRFEPEPPVERASRNVGLLRAGLDHLKAVGGGSSGHGRDQPSRGSLPAGVSCNRYEINDADRRSPDAEVEADDLAPLVTDQNPVGATGKGVLNPGHLYGVGDLSWDQRIGVEPVRAMPRLGDTGARSGIIRSGNTDTGILLRESVTHVEPVRDQRSDRSKSRIFQKPAAGRIVFGQTRAQKSYTGARRGGSQGRRITSFAYGHLPGRPAQMTGNEIVANDARRQGSAHRDGSSATSTNCPVRRDSSAARHTFMMWNTS